MPRVAEKTKLRAPRVEPRVTRGGKLSCRHCGAPLLDARMEESGFCCAGCSYVYRLVHEQGLAGYYTLKETVTAPADPTVFQPRDYAWIEAAQREAERSAPPNRAPELTVDVQGISCAGCVWLIERVFQRMPGARDVFPNAQLGTMRLRWVSGEFSAVEFARKLQAFGYLLGPAGEERDDSESRDLVRRIGLCVAFAMNVMLFTLPTYFGMESTFAYARLFGLLSLGFGTLSLLVGGMYFLNRAVRALREGAMNIDLPIAIGIVGAYAGSLYGWFGHDERFVYFDFVSGFILLMLVGRWAQVAAVERNQRRLLRLQPKARRLRAFGPGGEAVEIAPEDLRPGQLFSVGAGQTVPVESRLQANAASFSLASINGEAEPRLFRSGQRVPSGAVSVGREEIYLLAQQVWSESLLAQLLQPKERAGWRHVLLDRIVCGYLIGILSVATLAGIGWWIGSGDVLRTWSVVTAVLVVSCPCAVALAFPLADEMATVALRRRGVFVRDGDLWSKLSRVRTIAFDKTGTLTLETPVLLNPEAIDALDDEARAALHALVQDNPHPVSQCLLENLLARGPHDPLAGEVVETIGAGVVLTTRTGSKWALGRTAWARSASGVKADALEPSTAASSRVALAQNGEVRAIFHLEDCPRADARSEIATLRKRGYAVQVLSGDAHEKVATLAAALSLDPGAARGELTPQDKAAWLDAHEADRVLMLGDGANDSLAFDRALCRGTPVIHRGVLEQKADFYYLGRGIGGIRALFEVNAIRRRTQIAIMIFSVTYNLTAVGLAVAGQMNPLLAAILMPLNSLLTLGIVTGGMRRAFA